jgi:hypothetical protein
VTDLAAVAVLVEPVISKPVILADPADDQVLFTAIDGKAEILCTLNFRHFATPNVTALCVKHGLLVMTDLEALLRLEGIKPQ